jgi:hypothetical protein
LQKVRLRFRKQGIGNFVESTVDLIWLVSGYIALGIKAWALSDVIKAPAEAFPFLNRQTKNIWLAITIGSILGHILFGAWGFTGIIGLIACGVYLADIRVKINDMTGRR